MLDGGGILCVYMCVCVCCSDYMASEQQAQWGTTLEGVVSCSWDKGPTVTLRIITATRGHSQPQRERDRVRVSQKERTKLHHFAILSILLRVPSCSCHCYQFKWSIMQNGDDFGFRGCDRENCGLMQGRKEKKDGDFVGWEERVRAKVGGGGVWWGWGLGGI